MRFRLRARDIPLNTMMRRIALRRGGGGAFPGTERPGRTLAAFAATQIAMRWTLDGERAALRLGEAVLRQTVDRLARRPAPRIGASHADVLEIARHAVDALDRAGGRPRLTHCETDDGDRTLLVGVVLKATEQEVRAGDAVARSAILIHREGPGGGIDADPRVLRMICVNGLIAARRGGEARRFAYPERPDPAFERGAVAGRLEGWIPDAIHACLRSPEIDEVIARGREAAHAPAGDPRGALERAARGVGVVLSREERRAVVRDFGAQGGRTRWDLANAITSRAHLERSPIRALRWERLGASLLAIPAALDPRHPAEAFGCARRALRAGAVACEARGAPLASGSR